MTQYGDFDFLIVNFPYLSSNIPESPAYGVFVSQLIRYLVTLGLVQNMKIFCSEDLFWFSKLLKQGYSSRTTFRKFPVVLSKSWRVPHVGQELLTLSGKPDFTPFGEFMIYSFAIHMHCVLLNLSV